MENYDDLYDNKGVLENSKNANRSLEQVLEDCGQTDLSKEELEAWKYAYENVYNWDVVEKRYKKKSTEPVELRKDLSNDIETPEIVVNAVILIEMLTIEAYGWYKFYKLN